MGAEPERISSLGRSFQMPLTPSLYALVSAIVPDVHRTRASLRLNATDYDSGQVFTMIDPSLEISFDYDSDSNLYMLSRRVDARTWNVTIVCRDGERHIARAERFFPYPGTNPHENEPAWSLEYYQPESIEITRPGMAIVSIPHPERSK